MSEIPIPQVLSDIINEELSKANFSIIDDRPDNSKSSFIFSPMQMADYTKPLEFKWEPKALAKVQKMQETADGLYISVGRGNLKPDNWILQLEEELKKKETQKDDYDFVWRTKHEFAPRGIPCPDDAVDAFVYAVKRGPCDRPIMSKWSNATIIVDEACAQEALILESLRNLKNAFTSVKDKEIAKYSVKDKSELMTPYDIWEENKISKGELQMNTYDVAYNEKKAAAQKAYDEAMIEAKKEKEEAAQKEANENAAKTLKGMYDAYVDAGFTPEQAEKFVTIALEKIASKV